jgi:hypothetical protein
MSRQQPEVVPVTTRDFWLLPCELKYGHMTPEIVNGNIVTVKLTNKIIRMDNNDNVNGYILIWDTNISTPRGDHVLLTTNVAADRKIYVYENIVHD